MTKITKLTPEQEVRLEQWHREWFEIGTCTDRADRSKAESAIRAMYARVGKPAPSTFIWCDSPATSLLALHFLKSKHFSQWIEQTRESLSPAPQVPGGDSLRDSLGASLRDSLWDSLWASLRDSLGASLRDSLGASLRDSLGDSLGDSLWDSLWASLRDSLGDSLGASLSQAWWGQHEAYWISFYVFCRDVLGVKYQDQKSSDLDLWRDIAQSCCWWWPFENCCIVSERPAVVRMASVNNVERLHSEDGPALAFADGWQVYSLHGVRVPEWLVQTPADEIDAKSILSEQNAEIRREIIRKVGIERIYDGLGATVLDKRTIVLPARKYLATDEDEVPPGTEWIQIPAKTLEYELITLNIGDGRKRPYLKMRNPSIDTFHIEGVGPECRTVEEANHWRKPDAMRAIPVSEDGEDYWQQGDVLIWPEGAQSLKPWPAQLT